MKRFLLSITALPFCFVMLFSCQYFDKPGEVLPPGADTSRIVPATTNTSVSHTDTTGLNSEKPQPKDTARNNN